MTYTTPQYPQYPTNAPLPPQFTPYTPPPKRSPNRVLLVVVTVLITAIIGVVIANARHTTHTTTNTPAAVAPAPVTTTASVEPADPVTLPTSDDDDTFLTTLQDSPHSDEYSTEPDAALISLGHKVCDALDVDVALMKVIDAVAAGFSNRAAAYFVGVSVGSYCSEHADVITG